MVKAKNIVHQINAVDFEKMAKQAKQMAIKSLLFFDTVAKRYLIAVFAIPAMLLLIAYSVFDFLNRHKQALKELLHVFLFLIFMVLVAVAIWFCLVVVLLFTP